MAWTACYSKSMRPCLIPRLTGDSQPKAPAGWPVLDSRGFIGWAKRGIGISGEHLDFGLDQEIGFGPVTAHGEVPVAAEHFRSSGAATIVDREVAHKTQAWSDGCVDGAEPARPVGLRR